MATESGDRRSRLWASVLYIACISAVIAIVAPSTAGWQLAAAVGLGLLACGAFLIRVRFPYAPLLVAWVMALTVTQMLLLPALFSLGVRRRDIMSLAAMIGSIALLAVTSGRGERLVSVEGAPTSGAGEVLAWILNALVVVAVPYLLGVSMNVRRELVRSYEQRAITAEHERAARDREAVLLERQRIASEVHDILGHKLALISMQAGALEVNANTSAEEVERQSSRIGQTARDGLGELRAVVSTLDAQSHALTPLGLAAIRDLIKESRVSGAVVELDLTGVTNAAAVPEDVGRAGYRIVQESLTNAHRHAPGTPVHVSVTGSPGRSVRIRVTNQVPIGHSDGSSALSGRGLAGLRERARSVGGQFSTRVLGETFIALAELPWPDPTQTQTQTTP